MAFNDLFGGKYKSQFALDSKYAVITGVTKDSAGAALGSCVVQCFETASHRFVTQTTSDGSGNYRMAAQKDVQVFCVAYKTGAPDRAGTTVNTIVGVGGY
jgi:hypothetical protein